MAGIDPDDEDDPWLRQFSAGAERRELRAKAVGWGCVVAVGLSVLVLALLIITATKP